MLRHYRNTVTLGTSCTKDVNNSSFSGGLIFSFSFLPFFSSFFFLRGSPLHIPCVRLLTKKTFIRQTIHSSRNKIPPRPPYFYFAFPPSYFPPTFFSLVTLSFSMKERQNGIPSVLVETIAGLTAGFLSTLVAHPLDLVKVRLQGKCYCCCYCCCCCCSPSYPLPRCRILPNTRIGPF